MAELLNQRRKDYFDNLKAIDHRHKKRKLSEQSHALTSKQVHAIKTLLEKDRTKHLHRAEREWAKRKRRRQLGIQHRRLKGGWMFLNPIRKLIPRKVRVDNYIPDYLFYFCNALIFIFSAVNLGACTTIQSVEILLGQMGVLSGIPSNDIEIPLLSFGLYQSTVNAFIMFMVIIGFNVFYGAVKEGHWAYFILMLGGILAQGFLGFLLINQNACSLVSTKAGDRFTELVNNYYFSVPAIDEDGRKVYNPDGSEFIIRTYEDANMMDVFQSRGGCCGSSSFRDYFVKPNPAPPLWKAEVPQSCCTPLWNQNMYCTKEIPTDPQELSLKISQEGCKYRVYKICENTHHMLSFGAINIAIIQFALFLICCLTMVYQLRQIRQLERPTHFNIPEDATNRSLPVAEERLRKRLIKVLSLDPDELEISDDLLEAINKIRRELGLEDLGRFHQEYILEEPEVVTEPPHRPPQGSPPVEPVKVVKNVAKDVLRTRLDIFELRRLKPYYKGMFSATYEQENKAVKHKFMKELKKYANKYHTKERYQENHSTKVKSKFGNDSPVGNVSKKGVSKLVSYKSRVKANPLGGTATSLNPSQT